jgi:hypothetical protein
MRTISARLGLSDVGLAKACRKAAIPVPPRGYWNRKQAGHRVARLPLPPREPGHSDQVTIGQDQYWRMPAITANDPVPTPPVFDEPLEDVRSRIEKRTGAVRVSPNLDLAHPNIRALLAKDDARREKQKSYPYLASFYEPIFDAPTERRRLRIMNALLLALAKQGFGGSVRGDKGEQIDIGIGQSTIELALTVIPSKKGNQQTSRERLRLAMDMGYQYPKVTIAEDADGKRIEDQLRKVVIDLIVEGEARYRQGQVRNYEWCVKRRLELIEDAKRQKREAEEKERARIAALEQAKIDRLLSEAAALQTANTIRAYVHAVREASASLPQPIPADVLADWEHWAHQQADSIDPVTSRRFLDLADQGPARSGPGDEDIID